MIKIGNDAYCIETNGHTALLTSGRLILVDTGTNPDAEKLLSGIQKTGYKANDIGSIIITHTHPDHVGGLAKLKEISNSDVIAHELEAEFITKEKIYEGPPGPSTQTHPGTPVDHRVSDGQIFEGLLVIHTPGHTPGHISLLDTENSLLLAGDSFRNDPNGFAPMPDMYNFDPKLHLESIKKLANYSFEKIIFGHGNPVNSNASKMFKKLINQL